MRQESDVVARLGRYEFIAVATTSTPGGSPPWSTACDDCDVLADRWFMVASAAASWQTLPMPQPLAEILADHHDAVMTTWETKIRGTITPESMPALELIDHLPAFLDELIAALRAQAGDAAAPDALQSSAIARHHGEQRLRLGFSVDAVVREYGALHEAIVMIARQAGGRPTVFELNCVFGFIIEGIARAVSEYALRRDAEVVRQHNEHIAFIAHELRNPLAAAATAHEILKAQGHLPSASRAGEALARGLTSMQELIDHALIVAKVVSGVEVQREPVLLRELLLDTELMASTEADERGVRLDVDIPQDAMLGIDRRLMRSAINNIVRNAVKYTARGTSVNIRSRIDGDHVLIEVEDCCGGLPPGKIEAAFVPFVRLTTRVPGFGLGLAIAKQAIDAHGGAIRVQNLPGKGCMFVIELPLDASSGAGDAKRRCE